MKTNINYNEPNLETMAKMPDCFIDLTVTSPPYDDLRTYNGYSFPFKDIAKELYRVTKEGGVVVWIVGDETKDGSESGTSFRQALYFMECGFNLHDTMIWSKPSPFPSSNRYHQWFEYMFIFSKGTPIKTNIIKDRVKSKSTIERWSNVKSGKVAKTNRNKEGEKIHFDEKAKERFLKAQNDIFSYRRNIWDVKAGFGTTSKDVIAFDHPAIFPEQLAYDHIISWSNEGDLIYDPFMGSGTVAKTAICANRNWIGSEISKEYCDIIEKRLEPLRNNLFT